MADIDVAKGVGARFAPLFNNHNRLMEQPVFPPTEEDMSPKINKVLFASDLSENSRHAFKYASSLVARYNASLVLVHVLENLKTGIAYRIDSILGEGHAERMREQQKESARSVLIGKRGEDQKVRDGLAQYYGSPESLADASFEVVIAEGEVADEVLRVTREKGCDLIVIGSHKGLLGGTALSGLTKSVLSHANVPVFVVPPPENQ